MSIDDLPIGSSKGISVILKYLEATPSSFSNTSISCRFCKNAVFWILDIY